MSFIIDDGQGDLAPTRPPSPSLSLSPSLAWLAVSADSHRLNAFLNRIEPAYRQAHMTAERITPQAGSTSNLQIEVKWYDQIPNPSRSSAYYR